MTKIRIVTLFIFATQLIFAQDYLAGKLTDPKGNVSDILYDRTLLIVSPTSHQTLYKVFDANKTPLYTIFATTDNDKSTITISISSQGTETRGKNIKYDNERCGLIFSSKGDIDTVFSLGTDYSYLISFADTAKDYPILHKLKLADNVAITLDPLSKLRVRKHNELVKVFYPLKQVVDQQIVAAAQPVEKQSIPATGATDKKDNAALHSVFADGFNNDLFSLRDTLYAHNSLLIETVAKLRNELESDISSYIKEVHVYSDEAKYAGEERSGQPQGRGVLINDGNVYDGNFAAGIFVAGKAMIKTKSSVYYGECRKDSMSGNGGLKYNNGNFLLGEFKSNKFCNGIMLSKENGEVFFGTITDGQRTGYGELRNSHGDSYYGEFVKGKIVKGYCKEVDQFGYSTYSKIENGNKVTVASQVAQAFFNNIHSVKDKAENQPAAN